MSPARTLALVPLILAADLETVTCSARRSKLLRSAYWSTTWKVIILVREANYLLSWSHFPNNNSPVRPFTIDQAFEVTMGGASSISAFLSLIYLGSKPPPCRGAGFRTAFPAEKAREGPELWVCTWWGALSTVVITFGDSEK